MTGMNAITGRAIADDTDHIRQSIRDILTTPIGSRIMRRDYGSLLPDLVDHPGNATNRLRMMAASVMAIIRWEPRVSVQSAAITIAIDGTATLDMDVVRRTGPRAGTDVSLSVMLK